MPSPRCPGSSPLAAHACHSRFLHRLYRCSSTESTLKFASAQAITAPARVIFSSLLAQWVLKESSKPSRATAGAVKFGLGCVDGPSLTSFTCGGPTVWYQCASLLVRSQAAPERTRLSNESFHACLCTVDASLRAPRAASRAESQQGWLFSCATSRCSAHMVRKMCVGSRSAARHTSLVSIAGAWWSCGVYSGSWGIERPRMRRAGVRATAPKQLHARMHALLERLCIIRRPNQ